MIEAGYRPDTARRLDWVDTARGIGILLVVYGHALRGQMGVPGFAVPQWAAMQDRLIYSFHMPLFFLLAGLFLERSVLRGRRGFLADKLVTVVYPYFLWSLGEGLIEVLADRIVNSPIGLRDVLSIPIRPIEQFWFLYALFLCQLVVMIVLPRRLLLVAFAIAGAGVAGLLSSNILGAALASLPYVVAGMLALPLLTRLADRPPGQLLLLAAAAWAAFALGILLPPHPLLRYAAAFAGSAGTIAVAMALSRAGGPRLLRSLGQASLAIYVMHTIFSAAARIALERMEAALPLEAALLVCTVVGVGVPWGIWVIACRHGLAPVLGFGRGPAATP